MTRQTIHAAARVGFALLGLVAIGYQIWVLVDETDFKPGNFFSFFTIESNLASIALLLYLAATAGRARAPGNQGRLDLARGAVTLYMATTGVVYGLLLSGYTAELQTAVIWVDNVVHRIMPVVMVVDWIIDPPRTALTLRRALVWLVFPVVYLVYSLVRGPLVDWYPYPFLDPDWPDGSGYPGVAVTALGIAVGVLAFSWVIVRLGEWRRREELREATATSAG